MSILLETTLGDLVIDLDTSGSPELCKSVLKLAKARYYSQTLFYNVQPSRFCQLGDPNGDGSGGACTYGLIASEGSLKKALKSSQRFLKSSMGRALSLEECREKGRVVATEMNGIPDTIGSQLLITTSEGQDMALDGYTSSRAEAEDTNSRQIFRSVGIVREDDNDVLGQIAASYCDADGRPYADIRVIRALIVDDPFDDPAGMELLYKERGVIFEGDRVVASPEWERPPEENIEIRIPADQIDPLTGEEDLEKLRQKEEEHLRKQDKSRAVVLEMLGDLPSAEIKAPENVLFVCKLNAITEDEDLELIFSRFDEKVNVEIIRDPDTGNSLQYAFIEFTKKEQAVEAYFKMNNALVDDRRIQVDFSQSVSKVWDKYNHRIRGSSGKRSNVGMPADPFSSHQQRGNPRRPSDNIRRDNRNRGPPRGDFQSNYNPRQSQNDRYRRDDHGRRNERHHAHDSRDDHRDRYQHRGPPPNDRHNDTPVVDDFGREIRGRNRFDGNHSDASSREERRRSDQRDRKHHKDKRHHRRHREHRRSKKKSSRDDYSDHSPSRSRDGNKRESHGKSNADDRLHSNDDREHDRRRDRLGEGENGRDEKRKHRRSRSRSRNRDKEHDRKDRERRRRHRSRSRSRNRSDEDRRRHDRSRDRKSREDQQRRRHHRHDSDLDYKDESSHHRKRTRHDSPDK